MRCPQTYRVVVLAAVWGTLVGCQATTPPSPTGVKPGPTTVPSAAGVAQAAGVPTSAPSGPMKMAALVRLKMVIVQLPSGSATQSEQLWSYLNEELPGRGGNALSLNGIRVGLGKKADWPEVSRILSQLSGQQVSLQEVAMPPGQPQPIVFRPGQGEQTIFLYRSDHTMSGQDYPPGDNLFVLSGSFSYDDPSSVVLVGLPAIRTTQRKTEYVEGPTGYMLANRPEFFPLAGLEFRFQVRTGDFILLGPGPQAGTDPMSPGRHFLIQQRDGVNYEMVTVIFPDVAAVGAK